MLTANGNQFSDWSAAYRIFKGERMNIDSLFSTVRKEVIVQNKVQQDFIYAHLDDTLCVKEEKKFQVQDGYATR